MCWHTHAYVDTITVRTFKKPPDVKDIRKYLNIYSINKSITGCLMGFITLTVS
jgi:hypothetical protein